MTAPRQIMFRFELISNFAGSVFKADKIAVTFFNTDLPFQDIMAIP